MHALTTRTPNSEALQAELHREELLREAASTRLARMAAASRTITARDDVTGRGLVERIRSALTQPTPPAEPDCLECA